MERKNIVMGIILGVGAVIGAIVVAASASQSIYYSPTDEPASLVSIVTIPKGARDIESGKNFEPSVIRVVIGVNNTVRWINQDDWGHLIEADNADSTWFSEATRLAQDSSGNYVSKNVLEPGESFELTFEEIGEFPYHSKPWNRGIVIVLPPL